MKNGILLVTLRAESVDELFIQAKNKPGVKITADLEKQVVIGPDGKQYSFEIDSFLKNCLFNGLDQIGWTLQFENKINDYEKVLNRQKPWLA